MAAAPIATPAERIDQGVYLTDKKSKPVLLLDVLRRDDCRRALVFSRTKHGANRVAKQILQKGIEAAAIHGNKSQRARTRALAGFKDGSVPVLVATDIAARGVDVEGITHVINYDLPNEPETYVHRIGRTARAGAEGVAVSFCEPEEDAYLASIERLMGLEIARLEGDAVETRRQVVARPLPERRRLRASVRPGRRRSRAA